MITMNNIKNNPISIVEVMAARSPISRKMKSSQLIRYEGLSQLLEADVYVKHENQNITGSFKIRGGIYLMANLKRNGVEGVVTFSTGNHGISIAKSASMFGLKAVVVVPENTNPSKKNLILEAGAELVEAGSNFDEAAMIVDSICEKRSFYYAHPANEPCLINGVGTEFVEIIEELPEVDVVILPLGGGSEVAAATVAFNALKPDVEIIAVQAERSSAAYQSWREGNIMQCSNETFAGGFATGTAYSTTFNIYKEALSDFILLTENEIYNGIALAAHYTRNIVEGAGGSTIMAAIKVKDKLRGKKVVLQFSGSNASAEELKYAYSLDSFS
ncbi:threonine/serine dehydratase [Photobacterium sp. OFAV2-7]|uniref:threonine ammonia-lyase n=1 Tax=Photobacterium sp. OFAV2-7 TaxID=2917748 RepID=UPI001EF5392D|nr:pyridoxal-phosphate dependent enzyme [Photobacterium sp. OFAV2-7]MCG7587371.1 pyridoxal-phosphate dependent enzyme [Photobacterium sp. OFAV2-7]